MKRARTTTEAAEFGQELLAVKQQLGHGHFLNYLLESGIGEDTARRWMRIAQQVEDIPELLELSLSMAYRVVTTSGEHRAITDSIIAIKRRWREQDIEEAIVRQLHTQNIQTERQVSCPAGKIDIVTPDALYEVELFLSRDIFFHALGQILLYRQSFDPTRRAIIAGLADPGADITDLITYARPLDVEVQFWSVSADNTSVITGVAARDLLHEIALSLVELTKMAGSLPTDAQTTRELESAARSLAAICRAVERRTEDR